MAESAAYRRVQELRAERTRAAYNAGKLEAMQSGGEKAPPTTTRKAKQDIPQSDNAMRVVHRSAKRSGVTDESTSKPAPKVIRKQQPSSVGTAKVYQRHVLFAVVTAFLIKMVSSGKLNPK